MPMTFRTIKSNLVTILGDAAASRYRVAGYRQQGSGASEFAGTKRRVQVVYSDGDFPKGKAGLASSTQHEIDFGIELTVSAKAKGNLSAAIDPSATDEQRSTAIGNFQDASEVADESLDELFDIIYQILMDGTNIDIGTSKPYPVSSRWVGRMSKDEPLNSGEYVAIRGVIQFTCQAVETITGDTGTAAGATPFDQTLDIDGDDNEKTGVIV
jgi:hypothetical protein